MVKITSQLMAHHQNLFLTICLLSIVISVLWFYNASVLGDCLHPEPTGKDSGQRLTP